VGFIDPGNWASNMAAGSIFGYKLLWIVTLSTIMLIFLQHNAAHLGISTGLCLSEAATKHLNPSLSRTILGTAMIAVVSTALAEILGAAIALQMLFGLPLKIGTVLSLHSEIIQSRQWQNEKDEFIKDRLKFEFLDTLFSMGVGWAINSAMIIVAAAVFFTNSIKVTELQQATKTLDPLIGGAIVIFFISDPFKGLILSQVLLSIQLPITVFTLIYLTSSGKVMGKFKND